jgi:beta-galactosidase
MIDWIEPRLDLWRAATDNDAPLEQQWRHVGLHRVQHRVIAVDRTNDTRVVRTRVAPAAVDCGLFATYTWRDTGEALRLDLDVVPDGEWTVPLPRLGLRFALPARFDRVEWFGLGPGEAYVDSRRAARLGRYSATVDEMQTPYVRPQENGARLDVRWATLRAADGAGLRVQGDPVFLFTARRWTTEQLDAARHTTDLVPGEHIWVNTDLAQHGLGSASCGPGVLPQYELPVTACSFSVTFTALPATSNVQA